MTIHVPAQYPRNTPTLIAFVGEAPSHEEEEKGIPLVGPSGRIFNAMMRTAGLDREDYLVTNVFDEKLPDNEVANYCVPLKVAREHKLTDLPPIGAKGFLNPEHRWHLDRLRDELLNTRPNVIVPLGATALWAFTGKTEIGSFRGSLVEATHIVPGAKLLPTFHPQFVMQQWKFFPIVTEDFRKALYEGLKGPKITLPDRQLLVDPTLEEIRAYVPTLLASDLLSVDIETGWGQITCIGFAPSAKRAIVIPFVDLRKPNRSYWQTPAEELEVWGIVKQIMESPVPKLGQNFGGYDAFWFIDKAGIEPRNFLHDTRLMHHALYPELPKDLEFMGSNYTTQGAWKYWARKKGDKRDD